MTCSLESSVALCTCRDGPTHEAAGSTFIGPQIWAIPTFFRQFPADSVNFGPPPPIRGRFRTDVGLKMGRGDRKWRLKEPIEYRKEIED